MSSVNDGVRGSASTLRVALTHPMRVWVDALEALLKPTDITVVAANTSPTWVRHAVVAGQVDVLLMHLEPPPRGLSVELAELFEAQPALGVVGLSDSTDLSLIATAVRGGVRGWVEPTTSVDHLVTVLHGVARGETWLSPRLTTHILEILLQAQETRHETGTILSALSTREIEVLECLARGLTRQEIAERYFLSPHTVRTHINNLLRKLEVHSTLAAVSIARKAGLAGPQEPS